jgi:hypothetical protein
MNRLDLTSFRCQPKGFWRDVEKLRGLAEVQPWLDPIIGGLVDGNAVMRAQRSNPLTRPAITIASHQSVPIQGAGDEIVFGDQHRLSYGGNHIG